jgi:signal transduction histidine kinase
VIRILAIPSLRWRLVAVMMLADLIVAITTGVVTYTTQRGTLHDQLVTRAVDGAAILGAGAAPGVLSQGSNARTLLQNLVSDVGVEDISAASVLGTHGCVIASTVTSELQGRHCFSISHIRGYRDLPNGDVRAGAPIFVNEQDFGFAMVTVSSSSANTELMQSTIENSGVRAIGLLIFFLLSLAIAKFLLAPLERLARVAQSIAGGNMTSRMPEEGTNELATVAHTFNDMAASLEQRISQLSFLASAGSILPNTFRHGGDARPVIAQFCELLGAHAAGLLPFAEGGESIWSANVGEAQEPSASLRRIAESARVADQFVDGDRCVMVVPVLGDAAFVALRDAQAPFSREEQQVVINFAYQLGIAADNSNLFRSQQEALQVKDQFLSIVSHELRTPLTSIKGYAQMLSRRPHVDQTDARFASNIDAQVSRLTRLVDDLLDVTRFSRGEFELTLAPTDLRPVIEETVARFRIVAPRHTFVVRMNTEDFTGEWDRDRLEQVLNNLLSNAVKYSPNGGEITVSVSRDTRWVTIGVRDQGMGIDEEHQRSLFERFYRAGAEQTDIQGLGLGLYVTRRIVDAHGGEITVTSTPGEGSEFTVRLPLAPVAVSVER